MTAIRDRLIALGGYVVEPVRSVRRVLVLAAADLDLDDLKAVTAVVIYLVLATIVVVWAASMYILVRAMTGVGI